MKPILQALLLADRVYEDKATGKRVIAGTFNQVLFKKGGAEPRKVLIDGEERTLIPGGAEPGSPTAYISLVDVRGTVKCVLRYVTLEDDKVLFQLKFTITCDDPLETIEVALPLPTLPTIAGVHALELLCDDEPIGSHRITVRELPEEKPT